MVKKATEEASLFVLPTSADVRRAYIEESIYPMRYTFVSGGGEDTYACGLSAVAISQGAPRDANGVQEFMGIISRFVDADGRTNIELTHPGDNPEVAKFHGFMHGFDGTDPAIGPSSPNFHGVEKEYMEGWDRGMEAWNKVKDLRHPIMKSFDREEVVA